MSLPSTVPLITRLPSISAFPLTSNVPLCSSPVIVKSVVPVPSALASGYPPACEPSWTTSVSLSVSTVTSLSAPVND